MNDSQLRTSNAPTIAIADEIHGAALNSEDSLGVPASESRGHPDLVAEGISANAPTNEGLSTITPAEEESMHRGSISNRKEMSHQAAMIQQHADLQQPVATLLSSVKADCEPRTPYSASVQSPNEMESLTRSDHSPDDELSNAISILLCTKEPSTDLCGNTSGNIRCVSEGCGSTLSSDGTKSSCSADQVSEAPSSISAGQKRAQDRDPLSEDEDDNNQKRHKKLLSGDSATTPPRLVASPFCKHDPKT